MSDNRQPRSNNKQVAPSSGLPYGYVPAYLPGSASLVEQLDQTLLIVLRDGRHLVGVRRYCSVYCVSVIALFIFLTHFNYRSLFLLRRHCEVLTSLAT